MKILVIHTGGTIGCTINQNEINVSGNSIGKLVYKYNNTFEEKIDFVETTAVDVLSENISYTEWNGIIAKLNSINLSLYNGVIITHGSDTLCYTSALIGQLFCNVEIPVVMVAANYPLDNSLSNGYSNFNSAVEFISKTCFCGVFVAYGNNVDTNIYLSTRIVSADPICDEYAPFGRTPFAVVTNNIVTVLQKEIAKGLIKPQSSILKQKPILKSKILLAYAYPNADYSLININSQIKAVLISLYHSATVCTDGEASILPFLQNCQKLNIPVFGCSFKNTNQKYATTNALIKNGLIPMNNISTESAYTKLIIAYNQSECNAEEYIKKNNFFEHIN